MDEFNRLKELAAQLPKGLRSDWKDTNHFELTVPNGKEYWWLTLDDLMDFRQFLDYAPSAVDEGKRLGLLMDIAEELSRLKTKGVL